MAHENDAAFGRQQAEAFDRIITLIGQRISPVSPVVVVHLHERSPDDLRVTAENDVWTLFQNGVRHLKNGATGNLPEAIAEALSRTSLRASPFAAALGIRPPQFEPIYFSIDYATGDEAALFLSRRLIVGAEEDFAKSRPIIQQKIFSEKPEVAPLKEQMALSFDVLAETYARACREIRLELEAS